MLKTCDICEHQFEDTLGCCPRRESHARPQAVDPLINMVIGERYKLNASLGRGAMGAVYRATQLTDGKEVAIKILHTHLSSDPDSILRFQAEAKAASSLMHPHIVRVYEVGVIPGVGQPYIAMELLEGITLSEKLRQQKSMTTREALPIMRQACEALAEAHSSGVVHRDIKPANIMLLNRFNEENFVVVLDFSIAKVIQKVSDVDSTTPGLILGSPAYMSPERFMGKGGDFRSDIYSMGIIMFQLLAGRAPFKATDIFTLMNEHVSKQPPRVRDIVPDSDIPDSLEETIARALAKRPEDRHVNMRQLLGELNAVAQELVSNARPVQRNVEPNESIPAPNTAPEGTGSLSKSFAGSNIFDIDPSAGSLPAVNSKNGSGAAARKNSGSETQAQQLSELVESGRWDKSLVARNSEREPRKPIRPTARSGKLPAALLAVALLSAVGLAAFGIRHFAPADTHNKVVALIKGHQLKEAARIVDSWANSVRDGNEQELYADGLLKLGKAFEQEHSPTTAALYFGRVPSGTKASAEATAHLRKLAKQK